MALPAHHLIRYSPAPAWFVSVSALSVPFLSLSPPLVSCSSLSGRCSSIKVSVKAKESQGGSSGRRVWRRRKLTKKDDKLQYKMDRIPFLEEQVRKIRDTGEIMSMDIAKLMLSQENRFDFVNEIAAEATTYLENNRDEYGAKKPILHAISNRMNEAGFTRSEAYLESDPFKPGPNFLKDELYD